MPASPETVQTPHRAPFWATVKALLPGHARSQEQIQRCWRLRFSCRPQWEMKRIGRLNALGEYVRDNQNGDLATELIDRFANCIRGFVIQIAGCFVKDQDWWT